MAADTLSDQPQSDDEAEARMRRSLGLDFAPQTSSSSDPLKAARQVIRLQTAAREHAERQLAQAQTTIHDLRTKLHHARRDNDEAQEAARLATTARDTAERT